MIDNTLLARPPAVLRWSVTAVYPTTPIVGVAGYRRTSVTELVAEFEADARTAVESLTVELGRVGSP